MFCKKSNVLDMSLTPKLILDESRFKLLLKVQANSLLLKNVLFLNLSCLLKTTFRSKSFYFRKGFLLTVDCSWKSEPLFIGLCNTSTRLFQSNMIVESRLFQAKKSLTLWKREYSKSNAFSNKQVISAKNCVLYN